MKIISKILVWLLGIIFLFILVNIAFGIYRYKWIKNYSEILNQKDRQSTISTISIKNPISILDIFYSQIQASTWENNNILQDTGIVLEEVEEVEAETWNNEIDPYDPEFEEDFNSFFGGTETDSKIKDLPEEKPWFVNPKVDVEVEDSTRSVGQQLFDKFNQQ